MLQQAELFKDVRSYTAWVSKVGGACERGGLVRAVLVEGCAAVAVVWLGWV